jgi:hypothetical protein
MNETPQPEASGQALVERLREAAESFESCARMGIPWQGEASWHFPLLREAAAALSTASPAPAWQPPATAPLDTPVFAFWESPTGYREYAVLRQTRWGADTNVTVWWRGTDPAKAPDGWMRPPGDPR